MNTYPSLPIDGDIDTQVLTGIVIDRAGNGAPRSRILFPSDKHVFSIRHPDLDATQVATFNAFLAANRGIPFLFENQDDGVTYTVMFSEKPISRRQHAGLVTLRLELVQA